MLKKTPYQFFKILPCIGLFVVGLNLITPLWAEFAHRIHGDLKTAGIAVSVYSFTYAVFTVIWASIMVRFRHFKAFTLVSFLFVGINFIAYIFISNVWQLYLLQFIAGMFASIQSPAIDTIYCSVIEPRTTPLAWGIYTTVFTLSIGIGSMIGAYITHYYDFTITFLTMGCIEFIAFFIALYTL